MGNIKKAQSDDTSQSRDVGNIKKAHVEKVTIFPLFLSGNISDLRRVHMKFYHLSNKFYSTYNKKDFAEILRKKDRPYTQVIVECNDLKFAVPLRSHINHDNNVLWTDKKNCKGLDFTKAVLILDDDFIDKVNVRISKDEHKFLLGKEMIVKSKMERCIEDYKEAKQNLHISHNRIFCEYSTLKYFDEYL